MAPGPGVPPTELASVRARGLRSVALGAVLLVAGLLVTVITYDVAVDGFYVVAFGPVIGGVVRMVSGCRTYRSAAASRRSDPVS